MKGTGWLILIVMFLMLASEGEVMFILMVGALVWWIVNRYRKTGRPQDPMKIIEDLFMDRDDHDHRRK